MPTAAASSLAHLEHKAANEAMQTAAAPSTDLGIDVHDANFMLKSLIWDGK